MGFRTTNADVAAAVDCGVTDRRGEWTIRTPLHAHSLPDHSDEKIKSNGKNLPFWVDEAAAHTHFAPVGEKPWIEYMSNGGMLRYYDDGDECQPVVRSFPFFRSIGMLLLLFNANPRSVTPPEFGIFSPTVVVVYTSPDNISRTASSNI